MQSRWRRNAILGLVGTVSFLLGVVATAVLRRAAPRLVRPVATVNGETLGEDDLRIAMTAYRRQAIGDLVSQRLVLQEARKRGLDTTVGTFDLPTGLLPDERLAWERQAQASQQRKRVVLSGFTSDEKHRLFESLAPDLGVWGATEQKTDLRGLRPPQDPRNGGRVNVEQPGRIGSGLLA